MSTNDELSGSTSLGKIRELLFGQQLQDLAAQLDAAAVGANTKLEALEQSFSQQVDALESTIYQRQQNLEATLDHLQHEVTEVKKQLGELSGTAFSRQELAQLLRTFADGIEEK